MKKVIVIGSGLAGMSAACFLAKAGYQVTVLEKNDGPGGRCNVWQQQGYTFDMGPSWYWMPDVFEHFFAQFGKKVSDYYELVRLDPSYRVVFPGQETWDIPATPEKLGELLEKVEAGAKARLQHFLAEAQYKYETGMHNLVYKPGRSASEFLDKKLLAGIFKLDVFTSISAHIRTSFKDERIQQLLEFPVLFLGAKPADTPALYSLMNYADISLGTWYPKGGMYQITKAIYALCQELGVSFVFNTAVTSVQHHHKKATHVTAGTDSYAADIVVGNADYHHLDNEVMEEKRNYSEKYWDRRVLAPSSLLFYLGIDKKIPRLQHHNLFFDTDFRQHAREIYDQPQWPENPLFYVSCTSITDPGTAPAGKENLFILVPVATGLEDTPETREKYYQQVMDRLEKYVGENIRGHVEVKRTYAHQDFISDYNAYKGNAYGLANTLKQTAVLKPSVKNRHLDNFYYAGQLTVPGPGVPPSLISGQVAATEIMREFPI